MRDLGTEPKTDGNLGDIEPKADGNGGTIADSIAEKPTDSHALAVEEPVIEGGNLVQHGWNREPEDVTRLVEGLSNEDFWVLVRRFNKVWNGGFLVLRMCQG
jgi:hypothetical protein